MDIKVKKLGERLVEAGLITPDQLAEALRFQQQDGSLLGEALIKLHYLSPEQLKTFIIQSKTVKLGELLLERKLITPAQFSQARAYQQQYGGRLGRIFVSKGFLAEADLEQTLKDLGKMRNRDRLGEVLINKGLINEAQLQEALTLQARSGGRLGEVMVFLGYISQEVLYQILAEQKQLGRLGREVDLDDVKALPYQLARRLGAMVLREEADCVVVAVEDTLTEAQEQELKAYYNGKSVDQVLVSPQEALHFWESLYYKEEVRSSVFGLYESQPENSAISTFTKSQLLTMLLLAMLLIVAIVSNWQKTFLIFVIIAELIYLLMAVAKFWIVMKGVNDNAQLRFSDQEVSAIDESKLPVYTLLIPVYKEKEVLLQLIERIRKMDYPKYKMDVRILLEQDDTETIALVKSLHLPPYFTPLVVPASKPQTKPKACNYGLLQARGKYVVIYDAEDRPEPDQLKKACLAFKKLPPAYVCVQAKLNYFNSQQNTLTKMFTQEYSMWFEMLLVGIMQVDVPIPLGGTSNHFKMSFLRQVGGWDPFNVTEDADLGIRLYKYRYKTAIIDSRTWEEANSKVGNWIRQRSRWIKGYMQTFFVHMRHPIRFVRQLGFKGFLGYLAMIFGTPFLPLINPIFWGLMLYWLLTQAAWVQALFPGLLYYVALVQLVIGNFLFIYMNMVGTYYVIRDCALKKRQPFSYNLIHYGLLTPVYWVLMSIAAYKALGQLISKPYYWEKTLHGLDQQTAADGTSDAEQER